MIAIATYSFLFVSLFFEVFLLVSFLERRFLRARCNPLPLLAAKLPRVCIVVPCFNESATLSLTMRSLLSLEYPADKLEIAVVDDGSTDDTLSIARQFESGRTPQDFFGEDCLSDSDAAFPDGKILRARPLIRVFSKQNGGKHTAMNLALEKTSADLIGCLDADSTVRPDALSRVVPLFDVPQIAAVTPGIHVRRPENTLQRMQHVEYRLSIFNRFMLAALGSVFITPGPFSIFRTDVVRKLGGWREGHSTEDMEMALRLQIAGYAIANQPQAVVHTATPRTLRALFRQRVRWTYGWLRNAADYRFMLGNPRFGNLGLIVLPSAIISIGTGMYFFLRILFNVGVELGHALVRWQSGAGFPHLGFDIFYLPTSALWFLVLTSVALILVLICAGSLIGTGSKLPPRSTPLFILVYAFLAPLWLFAAVYRAAFRLGVRWR